MKKLALVVCLFVVGCSIPTPEQQHTDEIQFNTNVLRDNLEYYKDVNKNVCFAAYGLRYHGAIVTYVPCTPEIERTAHPFHSNQTVR